MLKFIIVVIMIVSSYNANATQNDQTQFWVPEAYILSFVNGDDAKDNLLYPIASIIDPFKNCLVIAHKSEVRDVLTKEIGTTGDTLQLLDITNAFNLAEFSDSAVDYYGSSTIYLIMADGKLLMEIINGNEKRQIVFIDKYKGYKFDISYTLEKDLLNYLKKQ